MIEPTVSDQSPTSNQREEKSGMQVVIACSHFQFPDALRLARILDLGLEIQAFMQPSVLDTGWWELADYYERALDGVEVPLSLHGAFFDLSLSSPDSSLVTLTLQRYRQSIELAARLSARYVIFHSGYSPLSRYPGFPDAWISAQLPAWEALVQQADQYGIILLLENVWDESPAVLVDLIATVGSPTLQVCLDLGHVNLYSPLSIADWIETLGNRLSYVHANNNDGTVDTHQSLQQGTLDYNEILPLLYRQRDSIMFALEVADQTTWPEDLETVLAVREKSRLLAGRRPSP